MPILPEIAAAVSFFSSTSLLLSLVLSTRMLELLLFSQQDCFNFSCSWNLTKSLLTSHQQSLALSTRPFQLLLLLASHQESLALSTRLFQLLLEWVHPLAQVDLMREGEGFSNLMVEIRSYGWLRFGVSSLTLTLIIKSPFNFHLTN